MNVIVDIQLKKPPLPPISQYYQNLSIYYTSKSIIKVNYIIGVKLSNFIQYNFNSYYVFSIHKPTYLGGLK